MSEKMQPKRFMELCALLPAETNWGDSITPDIVEHIYQAALRTHENGGQESEAGAVAEAMGTETDMYIGVTNLNNWSRLPAGTKLYLAPPSAPAIETAAIMRAAEAVKAACDTDGLSASEWVGGYRSAVKDCLEAIIPQDGRTQLEEFGMKVATETRSAVLINTREDLFTEDSSLRAIVTNLIGVPPLNSETGESK